MAPVGEEGRSTAADTRAPLPSITYALSLWSQEPALPLIETAPRLPHTLLFVPGLQDTFGTVPYIDRLAIAIAPLGFNIVQPQLSSSLGGYGVSSIEADAQEIALVLRHLRTRRTNPKHPDDKVVVMGHSTGCQDMAQLLSFDRAGVGVDGVILQAPVSDREDFEHSQAPDSEGRKILSRATALMHDGKGAELLERVELPPRRLRSVGDIRAGPSHLVNKAAIQNPATTAYRFWSLYAPNGDDDYFSTDIKDEDLSRMWQKLMGENRRVLALLGEKE